MIKLEIDKNENGDNFEFEEICIEGVIMPNSNAKTGWIRAFINGFQISESTFMSGMDITARTKGRGFRIYGSSKGGKLFLDQVYVATTTESVWNILSRSISEKFGLVTDEKEAELINKIGVGGYQEGVIGAGTYFRAWGR